MCLSDTVVGKRRHTSQITTTVTIKINRTRKCRLNTEGHSKRINVWAVGSKEEVSHNGGRGEGCMEEGGPGPRGATRQEGRVANGWRNPPAAPLQSPTSTPATSGSAPLNPSLASIPTFPLEQGSQSHQVRQNLKGCVQASFYLISG